MNNRLELTMNKIHFWIKNARSIALPQSLLPAILAVSAAANAAQSTAIFGEYQFNGWLALVAVLGVACAHLGMNLADDYFDYRGGVVEKMQVLDENSIRRRMEKCHYIADGRATLADLRRAMIAFLAVAAACGLVIFFFRGWMIMLLMALGAALGLSYSGGPLQLSFRGYGELTIGLLFGPLLMVGVQYAACGTIDWNIVLISLCAGLLVTNILYTHSVIDADNDEKSQKMTFARLLGSHKAQLAATVFFTLTPFVIIALGVALGQWHWAYLFVFAVLPPAVYIIHSIHRFLSGDKTIDSPRWWMGPMGNWKAYQQAGIDWFLIRWLPARNLVTFFCIIITIVNIVLSII